MAVTRLAVSCPGPGLLLERVPSLLAYLHSLPASRCGSYSLVLYLFLTVELCSAFSQDSGLS